MIFTVPFTGFLYRYFDGEDHLYTTNADLIGTITINETGAYGYKFEGRTGLISLIRNTGLVPLFQYYNGEHFYTTAPSEVGTITPSGYRLQGILGYCSPSPGRFLSPLYQYWNGNDHFYTINPNEIGTITPGATGSGGYKYERVACYIQPSLSILGWTMRNWRFNLEFWQFDIWNYLNKIKNVSSHFKN